VKPSCTYHRHRDRVDARPSGKHGVTNCGYTRLTCSPENTRLPPKKRPADIKRHRIYERRREREREREREKLGKLSKKDFYLDEIKFH
jgi:hypothetical protein